MNPWQVFLTPHTDDETIGMAGSITRARLEGFRTLVVLVTDSLPSTRGARIFPAEDTALQRRKEWKRAMDVLQVTELQTWDVEEAALVLHPFTAQALIESRIADVRRDREVAVWNTVWGTEDIHIEAGNGSIAHGVCANALSRFCCNHPDVRGLLHAVYMYSKPRADRLAPVINQLSAFEHRRKLDAIECYKEGPDSIGYGYKSVPELFDQATYDPREFIMEL